MCDSNQTTTKRPLVYKEQNIINVNNNDTLFEKTWEELTEKVLEEYEELWERLAKL